MNQDGHRKQGNGDSPILQMSLLDEARSAADDPGDGPHVRVSARARRISIRVYPDARVEVVVPPRARPREIEAFVAAQRDWIKARRAQALRNRPAPEPFPPALLEFRATGERWRLHLAGGAGRVRLLERGTTDDTVRVLEVRGAATDRGLRTALLGWLKRAAAARLAPRVSELARSAGVRYSRVMIRRQRSRWGSCSVRGTISLNLCLLFQRPEVVDYLVIHELMHVKHMNHSPRFWAAVAAQCAGWRALDRELLGGWRTVPRWVFTDQQGS